MPSYGQKRQGCLVTPLVGGGLLLLAGVLAVGVGVIVYFVGNQPKQQVQCVCQFNISNQQLVGSSDEQRWLQCQQLAVSRRQCVITEDCPEVRSIPSTTAPISKSRPKDVRLPRHLDPVHYNVLLRPHIYSQQPENFIFDGRVQIWLHCIEATDQVVLHINKLSVDESSISLTSASSSRSSQPLAHIRWEEDKDRQFFKLLLKESLEEGQSYVLSLRFSGPLGDDLVGFYRSSYVYQGSTRWLATTQMQPTDARKAFPCFDEPAMKSTFNITLERRPNMTSLSNMPLRRSEAVDEGWVADHFEKTLKMSTYLLAFVVCDFEHKKKSTSSGVEFRVWARPGAIDQVDYALDAGVRILEFFEGYFDIPYPMPKQDMIAVPDFSAGAMENWGLITYREGALLFDPQLSATDNKQRVAVIISHELAHQWFGNLVTPSWWDDLWLNEGFASYMEYLGVNHIHPQWKMMQQMVVNDVQGVFVSDSLSNSHPIYVPVSHPDEISEIFDRISYGKGAAIIRMMNSFLGENTFRKGLTRYLNRYTYGNTHHEDLWRALAEQAKHDGVNVDVEGVMATWVLQMGYPVVTVQPTASPDTVTATQTHFLTDPTQVPDPKFPSTFDYTWMVPFTYTQSSSPNWGAPSTTWMIRDNVTISNLNPSADWFIGNVGQTGFYRVNYDEENWQNLIDQLNTDHTVIETTNRAQIIDDSFHLGKAGILDQLYGLRATEYLKEERDLPPWQAASKNLDFLSMMLQRHHTFGQFKEYILRQSLPAYGELGWNTDSDRPNLQKFLQRIILEYVCATNHPGCLENASQLYKRWMADPDNGRIPADLTQIVYCHGIRAGGQAEWDFAFNQYRRSNVADEKLRLLFALSCTEEPWLLSKFLNTALNKNVTRNQDMTYVIVYVSRNVVGRSLTWDFVRNKWDEVKERYGGAFSSLARLIEGVTESFNTEFELKQLEDFVQTHQDDLKSSNRAVQQVIERTRTNVRWMKQNEATLASWLNDVISQ